MVPNNIYVHAIPYTLIRTHTYTQIQTVVTHIHKINKDTDTCAENSALDDNICILNKSPK